jgi:branched-chain amino acid transport system permease protein
LLYASALFLLAAGLSLVFGVMRIVNLAHGSLFAYGAFVAAWIIGKSSAIVSGAWLLLVLPVAALAVAGLGMLIELVLLRRFYPRSEEYQLLFTFGLLLILEDSMLLIWGPYPMSADALIDAFGILDIAGARYPAYNLIVIGAGVLSAIGLWLLVSRTKFGLLLQATSQDRRMASALGADTKLIFMLAFGLGAFMAGFGGAVIVPTQAAVLGMGVENLVLAFVVIVIGGLGSLRGALVGALIVSAVRTAGVQFFPEVELAVLFLIAAVVLISRPEGLFGKA